MTILVTLTGKEEKQKKYISWLHSFFPNDELLTISKSDLLPAHFDGVVFTGGIDIDPSLYGMEYSALNDGLDRERDDFEIKILLIGDSI